MRIIQAIIVEERNACQALGWGSGLHHPCSPRELFVDQQTGSEMSGDLSKGTERMRGDSVMLPRSGRLWCCSQGPLRQSPARTKAGSQKVEWHFLQHQQQPEAVLTSRAEGGPQGGVSPILCLFPISEPSLW